jgi:anti-sigma factor ChrR (cupin superfamily)
VNDRNRVSIANLHKLASLYVVGALDDGEREEFERHLRQGCDKCAEDVRSFSDVANLIGESVSAAPPERLRKRLLAKVSESQRAPGILFRQDGLLIARSDELEWQALSPGILFKLLYEDPARKYNTSLVRMEPGAHYPSHHHAAVEELFMLSGDLHVENQVIRTGDYCRGDSGSIHGETFSDSGCLFLMMASQENQIFENRVI